MRQLTLELRADGKRPMYEQLCAYFTEEIRTGRLRAGEKLPSKRELCAHLGVSRSTVETAYATLVSEGYIRARPQSGYYVSDFVPYDAPTLPASAAESIPEPPSVPTGPDCSTASVDVGAFPCTAWARLYREVVVSTPTLLQRGDRQGDAPLRGALCAFLREYRGVRCRPEQIVVGAGMEYLSGLLVQLFPTDTVFGLEDPGYAAMDATIRSMGRCVKYLPMDAQGLRPDALEASGATVAYTTPSHQFPMGLTMPADRRSRLLCWAAAAPDRWLIEDDYDSEFRYGARPVPAMQGMDALGRTVYVGTFSRSLAPSIRLAWLVLPDTLLQRYRTLSGHSYSTVSRYEQAVMARFLDSGMYARYLRRLSGLYRRRRAQLVRGLSEIGGIRIRGSDGGLHFLICSDRLSEAELLERAAAEGVSLRGLSAYCREAIPETGTVVMGYGGLRDEDVLDLVERLRRAWEY